MTKPHILVVTNPSQPVLKWISLSLILFGLASLLPLLNQNYPSIRFWQNTGSATLILLGSLTLLISLINKHKTMSFEWIDDGLKYWKKHPRHAIKIDFKHMKAFKEESKALIINLHSQHTLTISSDFLTETIVRKLKELP